MTGDREPTQVVTLRDEFRVRLAKPLRALKGAIRTTLIDNDALDLKQTAGNSGAVIASRSLPPDERQQAEYENRVLAADDITPADGFTFRTVGEARDEFLNWLDEQIDRGVLESTTRRQVRNGEHFTSRYVQSAYSRGVDHADARLNELGVEVDDESLQQLFNRPIPQEDVERLYTRAYGELETVTSRVQTEVRRELTTAYSQGWSPYKAARNINQRVDVGISDAERLARTEIMNGHNTASRSRYGEYGVGKVEILGYNPCPEICEPIIENNPYPLDGIPRGGCPLHPNCRGTEVPATDSSGDIITASAADVARTVA